MSAPAITPNQISVARMVAIGPLFAIWFLRPDAASRAVIVWAFFALFMLDSLDGWMARRYGMITAVGGFLDPVADHLSIFAFFLLLCDAKILPLWSLFPLLARDALVTLLRQIGQLDGISIVASQAAKIKADVAYFLLPWLYFVWTTDLARRIFWPAAIGLAIVMTTLYPMTFGYDRGYRWLMAATWAVLGAALALRPDRFEVAIYLRGVILTAVLAVYLGSGIEYFVRNRKVWSA